MAPIYAHPLARAGGGGNAKRWAPSVRPAPKAKPSVKRVERSDSGGGGDGGGGDAPFDPASLLKNLRKVSETRVEGAGGVCVFGGKGYM